MVHSQHLMARSTLLSMMQKPRLSSSDCERNMPESSVKSMLPEPFDWCEIPDGKVLLRERRSRAKASDAIHIPAFAIAKYPITNAQYKLFVDAGGYSNPQWWTEE